MLSGLNLGNLSTALSLTGGDPSLVDRLREQQQAQPPPARLTPAPSIVPANANQALELTGSKYRVPDAPAPNVSAPPAPGARDGWAPTKLTPEEEAQFKQDMVTKPGYKDWYEEAKKNWGEAPNFDDPNSDYDYRGAWKNKIVPAPYEGDGHYHWGSATDSGQMLKSPDHPTAWMQHFMTGLGDDPVVKHGLRTEQEGVAFVKGKLGLNDEQARAYLHGQQPAKSTAPTPQVVDHRASAKSMQNQLTGNTNEAIQSQLDQGAVKSDAHAQAADLYGQAHDEGREGLDTAKARRDESYARKDANTKEAYASLKKMQEQLGNPPDQTRGKVLQIIGAILSGTKGGGGIGNGLQMLGKAMGGDVEEWQRGIAGNDHIRKSFLEMNQAEDQSTDAVLRHEQRISELTAGTYLNALKQVQEGAGSKEEKLAAADLSRGIEDKFLGHWLDVKARQAAAGAANKFEQMTIEQLAGLEASGKLPKAGRNVLESKVKFEQSARKGEADIGKTEADTAESIAKANAKANGEDNGTVHVGGVPYVASSPVEKGALTKFTEQSVALGGVQSDLAKLYQIRQRNEGKPLNNANDVRDAKLLINGLTDKLSNFYGGGAAGEAAAERTLSSIADPTDVALRGDPKAVYASISKNLQDSMVSGLSGAGFKPRVAPKAAEQPAPTTAAPQSPTSAAAPSSAAPVRLYRSDGSQTGPLDPSKARVLLDSGKFFPSPPPAPSPDAMANASDADYEEQVRRSQGYQ